MSGTSAANILDGLFVGSCHKVGLTEAHYLQAHRLAHLWIQRLRLGQIGATMAWLQQKAPPTSMATAATATAAAAALTAADVTAAS